MGVVYLAEDTKLGRKVALKFLSRRMALPEEEHKRFINEAQAAASLNHANISTIYEIEDSDEGPFIAMEYIDGENLSDRIAGGPLPIEDSIELMIQITERARPGPPAEDRPPRHQVGQHHDQEQRHGEDHGFRPGKALRPDPPDPRGRRPRHRRLHVARAGTGKGRRRAQRHLVGRRGPLRDDHGLPALRR